MKRLVLTLPYPPSVNHYWRSAVIQGHVAVHISAEGKEYRKTVKALLWAHERVHFGESLVRVDILVNPPDRARRDLDNLPKSLFDALSDEKDKRTGIWIDSGIWRDDVQVDDYRIRRGPPVKEGRVIVTIEEIFAAPQQLGLVA